MENDDNETSEKPTSLLYKLMWGVIGLLCVINLYALLFHFLKIAVPEYYNISKQNEFINYRYLA